MLQNINDFFSSFWIANSNIGFRKICAIICMIFAIMILFFVVIQKTIILVIGILTVFVFLLFLIYLINKYGYNKKIAIFDSFIIYDNKKPFSQDGCRIIRYTGASFSSRVWLDSNKNKQKSAYLSELVEYIQHSTDCRTGVFLHLGGCGNSIPLFLSNKYKESKHVVIEIDSEVIQASKKYFYPLFGKTEYKNILLKNLDAKAYVQSDKKKYSVIIQDIFENDLIPKYFLSQVWIENMIQLLKNDGTLVINLGKTNIEEITKLILTFPDKYKSNKHLKIYRFNSATCLYLKK